MAYQLQWYIDKYQRLSKVRDFAFKPYKIKYVRDEHNKRVAMRDYQLTGHQKAQIMRLWFKKYLSETGKIYHRKTRLANYVEGMEEGSYTFVPFPKKYAAKLKRYFDNHENVTTNKGIILPTLTDATYFVQIGRMWIIAFAEKTITRPKPRTRQKINGMRFSVYLTPADHIRTDPIRFNQFVHAVNAKFKASEMNLAVMGSLGMRTIEDEELGLAYFSEMVEKQQNESPDHPFISGVYLLRYIKFKKFLELDDIKGLYEQLSVQIDKFTDAL